MKFVLVPISISSLSCSLVLFFAAQSNLLPSFQQLNLTFAPFWFPKFSYFVLINQRNSFLGVHFVGKYFFCFSCSIICFVFVTPLSPFLLYSCANYNVIDFPLYIYLPSTQTYYQYSFQILRLSFFMFQMPPPPIKVQRNRWNTRKDVMKFKRCAPSLLLSFLETTQPPTLSLSFLNYHFSSILTIIYTKVPVGFHLS